MASTARFPRKTRKGAVAVPKEMIETDDDDGESSHTWEQQISDTTRKTIGTKRPRKAVSDKDQNSGEAKPPPAKKSRVQCTDKITIYQRDLISETLEFRKSLLKKKSDDFAKESDRKHMLLEIEIQSATNNEERAKREHKKRMELMDLEIESKRLDILIKKKQLAKLQQEQ